MWNLIETFFEKAGAAIGTILISAGSLLSGAPATTTEMRIEPIVSEAQEISTSTPQIPSPQKEPAVVRVATSTQSEPVEKPSSEQKTEIKKDTPQQEPATTSPKPFPTSSAEWEFMRPYNSILITEASEGDELDVSWDDVTLFSVKNGSLRNREWEEHEVESSDSNKVWQIFLKIVDKDFVTGYMDEFMTFDLPDDPTLAFVEFFDTVDAPWAIYKEASAISEGTVSYKEHNRGWGLGVNLAGVDLDDPDSVRDIVITLLHEYGHLLTLNETQIDYDMANMVQLCKRADRYLVLMSSSFKGCAEEKSYLQAFIDRFWQGRATPNGNNFVTKYASTDPEEDIAESFTDFILRQRITEAKDVGDEKIMFFYSYPKLVELRDRLRSSLERYFN